MEIPDDLVHLCGQQASEQVIFNLKLPLLYNKPASTSTGGGGGGSTTPGYRSTQRKLLA